MPRVKKACAQCGQTKLIDTSETLCGSCMPRPAETAPPPATAAAAAATYSRTDAALHITAGSIERIHADLLARITSPGSSDGASAPTFVTFIWVGEAPKTGALEGIRRFCDARAGQLSTLMLALVCNDEVTSACRALLPSGRAVGVLSDSIPFLTALGVSDIREHEVRVLRAAEGVYLALKRLGQGAAAKDLLALVTLYAFGGFNVDMTCWWERDPPPLAVDSVPRCVLIGDRDTPWMADNFLISSPRRHPNLLLGIAEFVVEVQQVSLGYNRAAPLAKEMLADPGNLVRWVQPLIRQASLTVLEERAKGGTAYGDLGGMMCRARQAMIHRGALGWQGILIPGSAIPGTFGGAPRSGEAYYLPALKMLKVMGSS